MIGPVQYFSTRFPSNGRGREAILYLGGTVVLTLTMFAVGWLLHFPTQNLPLLLSTLAGAQAALFGIVFAVTVLGIQLTTNRYSPRLIFLFIDGWPFRATFGVFVTSIGLDILLLSAATSTPTRLLAGSIAAAGGLALVSVGLLYWFVQVTLAQSTPEGLLDAIAHELQPARYLQKVHTADQERAPHPLHRVYSLVMAALSRGEPETAYRGVQTLDAIATGGLEHIQDDEDDLEESELEAGFEIVQEEYLPEIALHAYENDERRTTTRSIEALGALGECGIEGDTEEVVRYSSSGLSEIVYEAPVVDDANLIRNEAADTLGRLLKDSVPEMGNYTFQALLHDLNHPIVVLLRRDAKRWTYQDLLLDYFGGVFPTLVDLLIEHHAPNVEDSQINWHHPHGQDNEPISDATERFLRYHRALAKITEGILQYRSRNEEYPLAAGNFRSAWKQITTTAVQSSLPSYGVFICQTFITTAYYVDRLKGGEIGSWALPVANVMNDGNSDIVRRAFEDLQNENYANHKMVSIYLHSEQDEKGRFFARLFQDTSSGALEFEEWLDRFQERVYDRYRRLQK